MLRCFASKILIILLIFKENIWGMLQSLCNDCLCVGRQYTSMKTTLSQLFLKMELDSLFDLIWFSICDAIRQNESKVTLTNFLVFCMVVLGIFYAMFSRNPSENWLVSSPEVQAVEGFAKQEKTKDFFPFNWLYLRINICKFRLILLDHITYYQTIQIYCT